MNSKEYEAKIKELEEALAAKQTRTRKPREQRECHCGCGGTTYSIFTMGHDARHKGQQMRKFEAGDKEAGQDLINHGWYTAEELAERVEILELKKSEKIANELKKANAKEVKNNRNGMTTEEFEKKQIEKEIKEVLG